MFVDEPDIKVADEFAKDLKLIQADIEAGRVLYITALEPHKEGWWAMLQEFAQIANTVIKKRTPWHARILLVYDERRTDQIPLPASGAERISNLGDTRKAGFLEKEGDEHGR